MADTEHLHPEFKRRIERACELTGASLTSGARSTQRQAQLFQDFQNGTGNPANPPGHSWHEFGDGLDGGTFALAVDFVTDAALDAVRAKAAELQLCFPTGEKWHAQPIEITVSARVAGAEALVPAFKPVDPSVLPAEFTYIFGGEDWLWLGAERVHTRCASAAVLEGLKNAKQLVGLGEKTQEFHDSLTNLAHNSGFLEG